MKAHVQRLDKLSLRARAALACTCIQHVWDLYRSGAYSYPMSKAPVALREASVKSDAVEEALHQGWQFARDGRVDEQHLQHLREFIGYDPPGVDGEEFDELSGSSWVTAACRHMLNALSDPTPNSTLRAVNGCRYAVGDGLSATDEVRRAESKQAAKQALADSESEWQVLVLERVEQLGDQTFEPGQFADLLAIERPWRRLLQEYARLHLDE